MGMLMGIFIGNFMGNFMMDSMGWPYDSFDCRLINVHRQHLIIYGCMAWKKIIACLMNQKGAF